MMTAHRNLVALTPQDMPGAQAELAEWCREKILELSRDLRDARQNLRQAKAMKWKHMGWVKVAKTTVARMLYYTKIRAAVRAGYLIVPNFDVEVMAVRVNRERPPKTTGSYKWDSKVTAAKPDLSLPAGAGRYVDGEQFVRDDSYETTEAGKPKHVSQFTATDYDAPDFPVLAVKPVVLEATAHAMSLRIFDQIGVVTGRKQDPVVVGTIFDPADKYRHKRVSFFIAWWLDTKTL